MPGVDHRNEEAVASKSKPRLKKPPLFKILLHNDDYTTMEFVVYILTTIFQQPAEEAIRIMLQVHQQGIGVAGVFTYEIGETKVTKVLDLAKQHEYPLLCTMEPE
jgi:ATP-dependent Clp protease adaptor protein ClpS